MRLRINFYQNRTSIVEIMTKKCWCVVVSDGRCRGVFGGWLLGGGSALLPAPIPPVTLDELVQVTRLLARRGATIHELNTLRKHVELMKGGGLAMAASPAQVRTDRFHFHLHVASPMTSSRNICRPSADIQCGRP